MMFFGGTGQDSHYYLLWAPMGNLGARKLVKRSMTSARAATEHSNNGQIGQPAACMIENNPCLSRMSVFGTRDYGPGEDGQ